MLLNNQWVTKKKKKKVEIKKYLEKNENGNAMIQKLRNTAKAVQRAKFALSVN